MMNERRQSDSGIVPMKPPNNTDGANTADSPTAPKVAEVVEGRPLAKENAVEPQGTGHRTGLSLHRALDGIRQADREKRKTKLVSLYHHVSAIENLRWAYHEIRRNAAAGIDGQTWEEYGKNLEANLADLSGRLARQAYRPKPARRVYIPKPDGRERPLGIPALEDKLVQMLVAQMLTSIWEAEFLGFSYGFRPGRSAHNALDAVTVGIEKRAIGWVLDADIRGFFDTVSHEWVMQFVGHRVGDPRMLRLIRKWLKAGVQEEGRWTESKEGTPQGGLVSPVLANIYLHYVLDLWAHHWRRQKARGEVIIVRYADDFIVGFEHRSDAEQFKGALTDRLRQFNLELHAEKTRLIEFGRHAARNRTARGERKPETFDFLGFTHYCGTTRSGRFSVKRRTMSKRMRAKLVALKQELRRRLHEPLPTQGRWLALVLSGHYRYFGVPWNWRSLEQFRYQVIGLWLRALRRRSQRSRMTWTRMLAHADRWLPTPKLFHPYPDQRLVVTIQGRSRMR
jgi:RNA-directed DNA polymerase